MKKLFLVFAVISLCAGCSKEVDIELSSDVTDNNWVRHTDVEKEHIFFGSDKHFSYYEASGSPVGDYDLCESYRYDGEKIILKCDSKSIDNIFTIDSVTDDTLVLKHGDDILTFYIEHDDDLDLE